MENSVAEQQIIKSIGTSGQISLGKEYAGRKVLVESPEQGVWVIRTVTIVPDNERWLHEPTTKESVAKALVWAKKNAPKASNPDQLPSVKPHVVKRKARST
jgi:hypothetical protein